MFPEPRAWAALLLLLAVMCVRADDDARIRAWLEPAADIVAGQQLRLVIEVSTARWFSAGARIPRLELEGAVVLAREKFALNSTREVDGETWTVQQYALTIHPRHARHYTIPALQVRVQVAGEGGGSIERVLETEALAFEARIPAALKEWTDWVASPGFTVNDVFDREPAALGAGDALRRSVVFEALDVPAMMLPAPRWEAPPGVRAYSSTPRVEDQSDRGIQRARRVEVIDYVIEEPGQYRLPAMRFAWWNTTRGELEVIELPEKLLEAGPARAGGREASPGWGARLRVAGGALLVIALGLVALRLQVRGAKLRSRPLPHPARTAGRAQIVIGYYLALARGRRAQAASWLYRWQDRHSAAPGPLQSVPGSATDALMKAVYARPENAPRPGLNLWPWRTQRPAPEPRWHPLELEPEA